ncbi:hypothetical protein ALC57_01296, partial [Trachymyrmex cornetzi]
GKHSRCRNSQTVSTPLAIALACTCTPCYVVSTAIRLTTFAINGPCVHGLTSPTISACVHDKSTPEKYSSAEVYDHPKVCLCIFQRSRVMLFLSFSRF